MSEPKPSHTSDLTAKTQKLPALNQRGKEDSAEFLAQQEEVRRMIAADVPLTEILSKLVLIIESQAPDMLSSILLLSEDGNHIRHAVAPSLPASYVKMIDGSPIGPRHGSCGAAMFRGKPVCVSDILTDPLWDDYREHATAAGLRACWSTPIMSSKGKVLGSFAMYYREPRSPDGEEQHLTDVATKLAAEAIEHRLRQQPR
jgi:two-component system, cell cycle sensor histidine kinase and response regulator CckA